MRRKVVYIGNRDNALKAIIKHTEIFDVIKVFIEKSSLLEKSHRIEGLPFELFNNTVKDRERIIDFLLNCDFDFLISNGCPFIIPASKLKEAKPNVLMINTHPTVLPQLKGPTPLNGVFVLGVKYLGATSHYIDDGIDTGRILFQKKVKVTADLDQGLVYYISFDLESYVFDRALELLIRNNFQFKGKSQTGKSSYFSRIRYNFQIDFMTDSALDICNKIRSLGTKKLGLEIEINNNKIIKAVDCEEIINPYLSNKFYSALPGSLLYTYDDNYLVKTINGIVKIRAIQ